MHRCSAGTSRRTCSTWRPHPDHVVPPQVRHVARLHIALPLSASRCARARPLSMRFQYSAGRPYFLSSQHVLALPGRVDWRDRGRITGPPVIGRFGLKPPAVARRPSVRPGVESRRAKCRCNVDADGTDLGSPACAAKIAATCAVRAGASRVKAAASLSTAASVQGAARSRSLRRTARVATTSYGEHGDESAGIRQGHAALSPQAVRRACPAAPAARAQPAPYRKVMRVSSRVQV